jgi:hypothetical protein
MLNLNIAHRVRSLKVTDHLKRLWYRWEDDVNPGGISCENVVLIQLAQDRNHWQVGDISCPKIHGIIISSSRMILYHRNNQLVIYVYVKRKSKINFFKNCSQFRTSRIRFTLMIDIGFHGG